MRSRTSPARPAVAAPRRPRLVYVDPGRYRAAPGRSTGWSAGSSDGLATVDQRLRLADLADQDRLAGLIACQRPLWQPGTRQGYHCLTSGWIAAELIRRTDPARRTLGRFFRDEVAVPLGLDFHIGLPPDLPDERVARIKAFHGMQLLLHPTTMPPGMLLAFVNPWSLTVRTFMNPRMASPGAFDRPELRRVEIPAAGGIGSARAIAGCFGELATGAKTRPCGLVAARWTS